MKDQGKKVTYKKKGPRTMVDGLTEVRQRLLKIIEGQAQMKSFKGKKYRCAIPI